VRALRSSVWLRVTVALHCSALALHNQAISSGATTLHNFVDGLCTTLLD